jgi:hypothetical protein
MRVLPDEFGKAAGKIVRMHYSEYSYNSYANPTSPVRPMLGANQIDIFSRPLDLPKIQDIWQKPLHR